MVAVDREPTLPSLADIQQRIDDIASGLAPQVLQISSQELPRYFDVRPRTSDTQITQYRAVGNWGLQFAACGGLAYREAKARGLGRQLPLEWFLQDIKN